MKFKKEIGKRQKIVQELRIKRKRRNFLLDPEEISTESKETSKRLN